LMPSVSYTLGYQQNAGTIHNGDVLG